MRQLFAYNLLTMFKFVLVSCLVGLALAAPRSGHRIVNGEDIDITRVPYQIELGTASGSIFCGGSIISKRFIVTAAHCFNDKDVDASYAVLVGISRTDKVTLDSIKSVKKVNIHPAYDRNLDKNDIAVLELDDDLVYSKQVQPVSLPTQGASVPTGHVGYISGWGALYEEGPSSRQLQGAEVEIFKPTACAKVPHFDSSIMLCAGSLDGSVDSCQGDSGGPLVANGVLYGVTSYGVGCAKPGFPGVYANVASYRNFIAAIARF